LQEDIVAAKALASKGSEIFAANIPEQTLKRALKGPMQMKD